MFETDLSQYRAVNVFRGIQNNPLFVGILVSTAFLQVLIVQYGSIAFAVVDGGLDARLWGYSIMFGAISLPVKQIVNVLFLIYERCSGQQRK